MYYFLFALVFITSTTSAMLEPIIKKQKIEKYDSSLLGKFPTDIKKIIFEKMLEKTMADEEKDASLKQATPKEKRERELYSFKKTLQGIRRYIVHEQQFENFKNLDTAQWTNTFLENPPTFYEIPREIKTYLVAAALGTENAACWLSQIADNRYEALNETLFHAAKKKLIQPFTFLIRSFANFKNETNNKEDSLLMVAAKAKNRIAVKDLLKAQANIHYINEENILRDIAENAMTKALEGGDVSIIEELLKAGATTYPESFYILPRHCLNINEIFSLLKKYNALSLHDACRAGRCDLVASLLQEGNTLDDEDDDSLLARILEGTRHDPIPNLNGLIEFLIKSGIKINVTDSVNVSPLMRAALLPDVTVAKILIAAGADLTIGNDSDETALHYAAEGNAACIPILLAAGAAINKQSYNGDTALHIASAKNNLAAAQELLKHAADTTLKNYSGKTALMIAKENGYDELITLLSTNNSHSL